VTVALDKLENSCVETPNRAVYALFWAISVVGKKGRECRVLARVHVRLADAI